MATFRSARFLLLILSALLLITASQAWAGPDFNEGEWSFTSQTEMPGMAMSVPPMTFRQCMTGDDAVPQQEGNNPECKMIEQRTSGNTLHWKVRCDSEYGRTDIKGSVTYSGDSMTGTTYMTSNQGGHAMTMTTRMQGKRTGPCR